MFRKAPSVSTAPDKNSIICPLCGNKGHAFWKDIFLSCNVCSAIFRTPGSLLAPEAEKKRYETHLNDVYDTKYRQFVSPLTNAVMSEFTPDSIGLDFGAGTGPVISKVLEENGYVVKQYDPFFHNTLELLQKKYDYIVCCEVIEHFYSPRQEFELLYELLKPGMKMYCMTHIFTPDICFDKWYYKNDPTHVFIYRKETFDWIKKYFDYSAVIIEERLIRFVK